MFQTVKWSTNVSVRCYLTCSVTHGRLSVDAHTHAPSGCLLVYTYHPLALLTSLATLTADNTGLQHWKFVPLPDNHYHIICCSDRGGRPRWACMMPVTACRCTAKLQFHSQTSTGSIVYRICMPFTPDVAICQQCRHHSTA